MWIQRLLHLQVNEVIVGLTHKEQNWVVHKAKQFKWESNSFLWVWVDGQVQVVVHPKQHENLMDHTHE
jgi:hypothetical protein